MKTCIMTVCTDDEYQYYIPLFVYTAKKAYPKADIKIFVTGKLKASIKKLVGDEVIEHSFKDYPKTPYISNALRHIVHPKYLKSYDIVWITDVDFLIFPQGHFDYYLKIMRKNKLPYASFRSAIRRPKRPNITPKWDGMYTRLVSGTAAIRPKNWYKKTKDVLHYYRYNIKRNLHDSYDFVKPGTYREYDEVLFYRICATAGLKTSHKRWHFPNGTKFNYKYRDIHLGDFKFKKRLKWKIKQLISNKNLKMYKAMQSEEQWQKIRTVCSKNPMVRENLRRLDKYTSKTLSSTLSSEAEIAKTTLENASEACISKDIKTGTQ